MQVCQWTMIYFLFVQMAHVPRGRRKGCEDNEKDSSPEWKRSNPTQRHQYPYFHHVIGASSSLQISDGSLFETKTWSCREVNRNAKLCRTKNNQWFQWFSCAAVPLWVMPTSFGAAACGASPFSWHFSGCSFGNLLIATRDISKLFSL